MIENKKHYTFVTLANNPDSPFYDADKNRALLPHYFSLRAKVYNHFGMHYYTDEPNAFDLHIDTLFILIIDKNHQVFGGRRIVTHNPYSDIKFPTENIILTPLQAMLPHLELNKMRYGELGGLCFAKELRGNFFYIDMYRETYRLIRDLDIAFVVAEVVPRNIERFIKAAEENGAHQIMPRPEARSIEGDEDFRIFVSLKPESEMPLLNDEMKAQGIGKPLSQEEIKALIAKRDAIITQRKSST